MSSAAYRDMTIAGVLWGTIGPAAAIVDEHTSLNPLQTSFWRLAIAALPLALLAVLVTRGASGWSWVLIGLVGGGGAGLSQLMYFAAVASAGIAIPTLIANGLGPIFTALGQTLVFGQSPAVDAPHQPHAAGAARGNAHRRRRLRRDAHDRRHRRRRAHARRRRRAAPTSDRAGCCARARTRVSVAVSPQQIAEQSVRGFLADDTLAQGLGITVSHIAPGEVTAHLTVTADMLNGHGSAHGSILFAVVDTAFAMACNSHGHPAIGRSCGSLAARP